MLIVQALYTNGARKFVLIGIGQIGCSPNALAQNSPDGSTCVQRINDANQIFNNKLKALVDQLNGNTPAAKFIYINAYGIFQDLIQNPSAFGNLGAHFLNTSQQNEEYLRKFPTQIIDPYRLSIAYDLLTSF